MGVWAHFRWFWIFSNRLHPEPWPLKLRKNGKIACISTVIFAKKYLFFVFFSKANFTISSWGHQPTDPWKIVYVSKKKKKKKKLFIFFDLENLWIFWKKWLFLSFKRKYHLIVTQKWLPYYKFFFSKKVMREPTHIFDAFYERK